MKKIILALSLLIFGAALFADTLWVPRYIFKVDGYTMKFVKLENMKEKNSTINMRDNEYYVYAGILYYKVDGVLHRTSMFEIY